MRIMKQKRFDELVQNGYIIFMSLFVITIFLGLILDNEGVVWLSVIFLLYIPGMICAYCIQGANDSYKGWKKKRMKAKRLAECTSCQSHLFHWHLGFANLYLSDYS